MSHTAILKLPLIHSGQAQKEITHNEALTLLDILVHPVIKAIGVNSPPEEAQARDLYIIGTNPQNIFARHSNEIAAKLENGWRFIIPPKWLEVTIDSDGIRYRYDGNNWVQSDNLGQQAAAVQEH